MAIINCPECDSHISNTAKQCIHCGARISVCPECNKAYVGDFKVCDECGFMNNEEASPKEEMDSFQKSFDSMRNIYEQWKMENSFRNIYFSKALDIISSILLFGPLIVLITAIVNWSKSGIEMLTDYEDTLLLAKAMIISFTIVGILWEAFRDFSCFGFLSDFTNWTKVKKVNLKLFIQEGLSKDFSKMYSKEIAIEGRLLKRSIKVELSNGNTNYSTNKLIFNSIRFIFSSAMAVLMSVFAVSNVEIYMKAKLFESELLNIPGWDPSMMQHMWIPMIVIVSFVLFIVIDVIFSKLEKKECHQWVADNASEYFDTYHAFVADKSDTPYQI